MRDIDSGPQDLDFLDFVRNCTEDYPYLETEQAAFCGRGQDSRTWLLRDIAAIICCQSLFADLEDSTHLEQSQAPLIQSNHTFLESGRSGRPSTSVTG